MYSIILCNVNNNETAYEISKILVKNKLAACVNIIPKIKSIYLWNNKITEDEEYTLLIKSRSILFEQIKEKIAEIHSYEIPEIIEIPIINGSKSYLEWILKETKQM